MSLSVATPNLERDISEIISTIIWQMVNQKCEPVKAPERPAAMRRSRIQIYGSWNGTITVSATDDVAATVVSGMFRGLARNGDELQLRDALNELTNILGGNIKTLLPSPSKLSLPQTTEEAPHDRNQEFWYAISPANGMLAINIQEND